MGQKLVGKTVPEGLKAYFKPFEVPVLSDIPFIGKIFFYHDSYVYFGYFVAIVLGIYLYNSRKGLNLRMVGESPAAADAAGINVTLYKYIHILAGGALCGLGGAYLSLVYVPAWQDNVTSGRGWIAVALVIFCTWNPYRAMLGSFAFGGLDILGFYWHKLDAKIISALPYVATVLVLIFISMKKSKENAPPQGLSVPYFREDR
jgi:simple sugar transport system permease protein